jgi:stage II sporulation protein M
MRMKKPKITDTTFSRNFRDSIIYIRTIKNYIYFSLFLFFISAIAGYIYPFFFEEKILEFIRELLSKTKEMTPLKLIRFIILNNIQSSLVAIVFGIILGIIPFLVAVVNGYILGFVANRTIAAEGIIIVWRLFPHGILEIPAVIISIAMGLRLGMFLFTYDGKNKGKEFWKWILSSLKVFVLIVLPMLIIAGIVEGILIWFLN